MTEKRLDTRTMIREHLEEGASVRLLVSELCTADIEKAAKVIADSFHQGGKLLICGNGGSAADAQHFAAEFVSRLTKDFVRPALPALALTTDTSFLTAYTNDLNFEGVFERQVEAFGKAGDVLMGISTSGSSANVVAAVKRATQMKLQTIALCGDGGTLPPLATVAIQVPSKCTQYIQEAHLAIEHLLCAIVERTLYSEKMKS
jgi:D-sedoheptulose 7-phosphate isomerase